MREKMSIIVQTVGWVLTTACGLWILFFGPMAVNRAMNVPWGIERGGFETLLVFILPQSIILIVGIGFIRKAQWALSLYMGLVLLICVPGAIWGFFFGNYLRGAICLSIIILSIVGYRYLKSDKPKQA